MDLKEIEHMKELMEKFVREEDDGLSIAAVDNAVDYVDCYIAQIQAREDDYIDLSMYENVVRIR